MYRNAARAGPSDGHRQHAQKIGQSSYVWLLSYESGQTDKQTGRQTNRQTNKQKTDIFITILRIPPAGEVITRLPKIIWEEVKSC